MRPLLLSSLVAAVAGCAPAPLALKQVVLYQNGIGYFQRAGHVDGDRLRLRLRSHEIDDVLKTLTVIDTAGAAGGTGTVAALTPSGAKDGSASLVVTLAAGGTHTVDLSYAVPTPVWKSTYRLVLGDKDQALLQAWAVVNNASDEDWQKVQLTLATGAPLSFAVDLHTPLFLARPDVTGQLVQPTATGAVLSEKTQAADRDGDGIPDSLDKCPDEPETYNGLDDDDGCPDRGRVIIRESRIEILDKIYFAKNDSVLKPASQPILDATAATFKGNPEISEVEVQGHASDDESDVWGLSAARAASVRTYLTAHGIDGTRLRLHAYGATRPVDSGKSEAAREKNRRIEFLILKRRDEGPGGDVAAGKHTIDVTSAARSVATFVTQKDVAGSVRYQLAVPVSVPHGTSTLVSIVNQKISGEEIYLFRPESGAPGSESHPMRAALLRNSSSLTLEPGPVALFARGTFVGEGLFDRLHPNETALIPFALDGATSVRVESDDAAEPVRLVSLDHGVCTVENSRIHTTKYEVMVGSQAPARIFLRHARRNGFEPDELPPATEKSGDALLIPLPITPLKTSVLSVREHQPERREIRILDDGGPDLMVYLAGAHLAPEIEKQVRAAAQLRKEAGELETEIEQLRTRLDDAAQRSGELRESLRAVDKNPRAAQLKKDLLAHLTEAVRASEELSKKLAERTEAHAEAKARLTEAVRDLKIAN